MDRIFERNLRIVRTNHRILSKWIEDEPLIDWIPPKAGTSAFLRYRMNIPSKDLCLRLIQGKGVLLVPAHCFEMEGFVRIGYGCRTKTLEAGLSRFKDFLRAFRGSSQQEQNVLGDQSF